MARLDRTPLPNEPITSHHSSGSLGHARLRADLQYYQVTQADYEALIAYGEFDTQIRECNGRRSYYLSRDSHNSHKFNLTTAPARSTNVERAAYDKLNTVDRTRLFLRRRMLLEPNLKFGPWSNREGQIKDLVEQDHKLAKLIDYKPPAISADEISDVVVHLFIQGHIHFMLIYHHFLCKELKPLHTARKYLLDKDILRLQASRHEDMKKELIQQDLSLSELWDDYTPLLHVEKAQEFATRTWTSSQRMKLWAMAEVANVRDGSKKQNV